MWKNRTYTYFYHTLLYAYHNPDAGIKVTIFYFPLEETPERIMQRFMSYILYDLTDGEIIISPRDLRSSSNNKPVPLKVLELLKTDMSLSQIAEEVKLNSSDFNKEYNRICKRIVDKNYEKIEDWYYLNIRYGEYKKCNKCKEVKLTSKFSKNGNGLRSHCKKCMSKK